MNGETLQQPSQSSSEPNATQWSSLTTPVKKGTKCGHWLTNPTPSREPYKIAPPDSIYDFKNICLTI